MCSRLSPALGWWSRWLSMEVFVLWAGWADARRVVFSAMLFISDEMVMLLWLVLLMRRAICAAAELLSTSSWERFSLEPMPVP